MVVPARLHVELVGLLTRRAVNILVRVVVHQTVARFHDDAIEHAEDLRLEDGHEVLRVDKLRVELLHAPELQPYLPAQPPYLRQMRLCDRFLEFERHPNELIDLVEEGVDLVAHVFASVARAAEVLVHSQAVRSVTPLDVAVSGAHTDHVGAFGLGLDELLVGADPGGQLEVVSAGHPAAQPQHLGWGAALAKRIDPAIPLKCLLPPSFLECGP